MVLNNSRSAAIQARYALSTGAVVAYSGFNVRHTLKPRVPLGATDFRAIEEAGGAAGVAVSAHALKTTFTASPDGFFYSLNPQLLAARPTLRIRLRHRAFHVALVVFAVGRVGED